MFGLIQVPPFLQALLHTAMITHLVIIHDLSRNITKELIETLQTSVGDVFGRMVGPSGTACVFRLDGGLVLDHRSVDRVVLHPTDIDNPRSCLITLGRR